MHATAKSAGLETASREVGFSLMEVIIAIAIIGIVAISSATLTINGIAAASMQQRRQIAVTIASGAMETVSAQTVANLYDGRTSALVHDDFVANSAVPGIVTPAGGIAPTYERSDTRTPRQPVAVPTGAPIVKRSGTKFTTTTLIGSCFQATTGGDCATLAPPITATDVVSGYLSLIRVVVVVRWTAGSSCAASGCFYSTSTLVDPNKDLEWVTHD